MVELSHMSESFGNYYEIEATLFKNEVSYIFTKYNSYVDIITDENDMTSPTLAILKGAIPNGEDPSDQFSLDLVNYYDNESGEIIIFNIDQESLYLMNGQLFDKSELDDEVLSISDISEFRKLIQSAVWFKQPSQIRNNKL